MNPSIIDPANVRDLAGEALDGPGRPRILPAAWWAQTTAVERALLGHRYGIYSFPTVELVEHLRQVIGGRTAIEIGAGHGALAEALGIPATDNRQQEQPRYAAVLAATGQPPVRYGPNIIHLDAAAAVRHYQPQVVVASWVTHRYDPTRHWAGGNEIGVDEPDVLQHCDSYVFIGTDRPAARHLDKPIWDRPHHIVYPPWLYSRANGGRDFIAVWDANRRDQPTTEADA
jgi:hypothetical protein